MGFTDHVEVHLKSRAVLSVSRLATRPPPRHTYMPDLLVRPAAVVLEDVVLVRPGRYDELLGDGLW